VPCTVWSRVVGYFRPVENWNEAKRLEFRDRVPYRLENTDEFERQNGGINEIVAFATQRQFGER